MFRDLVDKILTKIIQKQKNRFKINYSFGFVLRNIETQSYRYYHSSHNNAQVLDRAVLISNRHDLVNFLNALSEEDFLETLTRPDTKWQIVDITNITFYVTKLKDVALGAPIDLPDNVKFNSGLVNFSAEDHLCFFRCLVVFKGAVSEGGDIRRCEMAAKRLFYNFCHHFQISFQDFKGINLFDFPELEDYFQINFTVYELDGTTAKLVQRSRELYSETMRLNVHENHLSLITDFEKYCHVFQCTKCNALFNRNNNLIQHIKSCSGKVRETFPGCVYRNPPTLFERLEEIGIRVPPEDRHYPFFACFDFETFFSKENLPSSGPKLSYEVRHVPMSVAIASCIPGKEDPVCFVSEGDLVKKMLDYLENLADAAYSILKEKFQYVFDALETSENCRKEKLTKEFDAYLQELIVLGFNSSSYDLNLIKPKLIEHIYEKIDFVIKKANNYQCIKTNKLRFLDIRHFLAGGFSYDKFLKAYKIQQTKFFFPYEYCTSLNVLNEGLPSHEAFYSDLKKTNISENEYNLVKETWQENNWQTLRDLLIFYNMIDVGPFVEAITKMRAPYLEEGLDIFKTTFSISGVARLLMMKKISKNTFFCLYPKRHADLYQRMREALTGDLSIVFTRMAVSGVTKIRPHQVENLETCQQILGVDSNSLYLASISGKCPTGFFCVYSEENHFSPDPCSKYGLSSLQWLSYISAQRNIFIQHKFNMSKRRVTKYSLPVDGFCESTNEVFEFQGCVFHGCGKCNTNRDSNGNLKELNYFGKNIQELQKSTQEKIEKLEEEGFTVYQIYECEWKKMLKQPHIAAFVKNIKSVQPKKQLNFEKILRGVQNDQLYGFLFVDIHTPEHLKEKYSDFPMIIKNVMVSRDDLSPYMKEVAEENDYLKKPRKTLISSYFGTNHFVSSNMLKFYLEMGLVVTRIYEFIEFYPEACFKELAEEIVETRRKGDRDPDLQVVALTKKLIGMSKFFILELVYSSRLIFCSTSRSQFLYNFINKLICCR